MIKAVIFDFYGVVCTDAYTAWQNSHFAPDNPVRQKFLELASENDTGGLSLAQFYEKAADIAGSTPDRVVAELNAAMKLDQGIMAIILKLRHQQLKTGLLSNSAVSLYDTLDGYGIRHLFNAILCSGEVGYVKPSRQIFELIVQRLDVAPDEAVFIDDIPGNVDGAERAGLVALNYEGTANLADKLTRLGILT